MQHSKYPNQIIDSESAENAESDTTADASVGVLVEPADGQEPMGCFEWVVEQAWHGKRLDKLLQTQVQGYSRSYLQQLVADGAATLDGMAVTKSARKLRVGERLRLELRPTPQSSAFTPEPMPIDTVYEDEHLRVIHKPAGLVVHPAAGNWSGTLLNGLLALDEKAQQLPRAGIVHRLDKDTSGLMLVARSRQAMDALVAAIAAREVHRQYIAVVHGAWAVGQEQAVDAAIGRDVRNRIRMAVVDGVGLTGKPRGKEARTDFECIATDNEQYSVLRCTLHTGRTHQIRVHAAHIGSPLVGDAVYGGKVALGMQRQALHAYRLALAHPVTGEALVFETEIPHGLPTDMSFAYGGMSGYAEVP